MKCTRRVNRICLTEYAVIIVNQCIFNCVFFCNEMSIDDWTALVWVLNYKFCQVVETREGLCSSENSLECAIMPFAVFLWCTFWETCVTIFISKQNSDMLYVVPVCSVNSYLVTCVCLHLFLYLLLGHVLSWSSEAQIANAQNIYWFNVCFKFFCHYDCAQIINFWLLHTIERTRKPCCRKETARCCKCSFRSKFANNIPYKYKTSHASKSHASELQTCWRKTQFNTKAGFKVNQSHVFGVSGKAVRQ